MNYPIVSHNNEIQCRYENMRMQGTSHKLADMLAHQKAPGSQTGNEIMLGGMNGQQFASNPLLGNQYAKELVAAGGSPSGKKYMSSIAKYPGDPEAWVSDASDVKRVCEERGYSCTGAVEVKPVQRIEQEADKPFPVAPDIVVNEVEGILADNPDIAPTPKEKKDLLNETMAKRSGHKASKIKGEL